MKKLFLFLPLLSFRSSCCCAKKRYGIEKAANLKDKRIRVTGTATPKKHGEDRPCLGRGYAA